jgi:hypothetical protein
MHIFASDSPPSWLASENSIGVPVSETHSVAIQLYTGACSMLGTHTFERCRPECAGPNDLVCDAPLGVGIAMCEKGQSRGPLIAIRGNNINLIFSSVPKLFNVTGTTTKSVRSAFNFCPSSMKPNLPRRLLHSFRSMNRLWCIRATLHSLRTNHLFWNPRLTARFTLQSPRYLPKRLSRPSAADSHFCKRSFSSPSTSWAISRLAASRWLTYVWFAIPGAVMCAHLL